MPQIFQFIHCHFHMIDLLRSLFLIIPIFSIFGTVITQTQNVDPGEPLYLSPLIEAGKLSQAMEASLAIEFFPVISYSGFITVNSTYNSNLFFWFFPAEGTQYADNTAPVILWNDGGPGISAFFSVFGQNGPYTGTADGVNYTMNPYSWHKKYNMIYIDNPVEVGFSFTENENGYVTSAPEAARDLYSFLTQFFAMFPHLRRNPFYNGGASYGATYAIQMANLIHQKNSDNPNVFINLTGLILDSPWIDAFSQVDYGDYLFNAGLLSENSREHFIMKQNEIRNLMEQDKYLEAFSAWAQINQLDVLNLTGFGAISNIYNDQLVPIDMTNFATQNSTRKALHVGSLNFRYVSSEQQARMHANMLRSAKPQMETLLQAGYKCLLYVGNMDCTTGHIGIRKIIRSLSWDGANDLIKSPNVIWREGGRVAGYNMTASNMTFLIVRNAGHGCLLDQPEWVLNAVMNFTGESNEVGRMEE